MSDDINPASETVEAAKSRLSGPIGTFILVWAVHHPKVIAFALFDTVGDSGTSQAIGKIAHISELLAAEGMWEKFFEPLVWTAFVLIVGQVISILWHLIADQFRYQREKITLFTNQKIYLYEHMSKNPNEFLITLRTSMIEVKNEMAKFRSAGDSIQSNNENAKHFMHLNSIFDTSDKQIAKLETAIGMIQFVEEGSLIEKFKRRMTPVKK